LKSIVPEGIRLIVVFTTRLTSLHERAFFDLPSLQSLYLESNAISTIHASALKGPFLDQADDLPYGCC
jgi:hypothetical protein